MRLIVARCEVVYTGRLNAVLPEALRLLMVSVATTLVARRITTAAPVQEPAAQSA